MIIGCEEIDAEVHRLLLSCIARVVLILVCEEVDSELPGMHFAGFLNSIECTPSLSFSYVWLTKT
jgi:hypothetical protein